MRRLLIASTLAVAALAAGSVYGWREYNAPGPSPTDHAVTVPRGSLSRAAEALREGGVIRADWPFEAAALLTRAAGPIKAAELDFPAGASLREVLAVLRAGKPIQHRVTIAEGLSARQVAEAIGRTDTLEGETPAIPEGSVLPETYSFERGATRTVLLERAARAMTKTLNDAWSTRSPDLPLASPKDALVLASIVERETAKPEERKLVAAVYLNRLRRGMRLQSDPTVAYGASGGAGGLDHGLTRAELETDTPYNTYRNTGLPPGPICMPGRASIEAATHPADSTDLFFVADGTGGHSFARTESDHARNVQRWRAAERARRQGASPAQ